MKSLLIGLFTLQGHHTELGPYRGQLELRPLKGDRVLVTRIVDYDEARFDGLKIQEVWQAEGTAEGSRVRVTFPLKRADVFQRVDGMTRTPDDFREPLRVEQTFDLAGRAAAPLGEKPIWVNERRELPSTGRSHRAAGALAMRTIFAPVMKLLGEDPFVRSYADHPAFKSRTQFFVFDPTDFGFLRANPGTLRVTNKVVDRISLVEAELRHDAYAFTLARKARVFDDEVAGHHLNELGLFSGAVFDGEGRPAGFTANGDGALWTGMYAGSQAMRWLVTRDAEALANFRRAVRGLILLLDVTGSETEFARTAHPMTPGETLAPPWRRGAGTHSGVKYIEGGNNDMIKGVLAAFVWANEILPDGDPLKNEVAAHAVRLPALRVCREWQRFGNKFLASGLAALATGADRERRGFLNAYRWGTKPSNVLTFNEGFYYGGIADWSGINLSMVSQVAQILLAKQVARKFGVTDPGALESRIVAETKRNLMRTARTYSTARRGFLTVAAHVFAGEVPAGPDFAADLEQAVWVLREIPASAVRHDVGYDFRLKPEWSVSAWPLRPWKFWGEHTGVERYYQGAYDYPIFEGRANTTDNYWIGAFDYAGAGSASHRHGRIDYLTTYWMGRFGGLLDEGS